MIEIRIYCNGCGNHGAESRGIKRKNAGNLRITLARIGWKNNTNHAELPGGEDWCPQCWNLRQIAEARGMRCIGVLEDVRERHLAACPLSVHVVNCLWNHGCVTVNDALKFTPNDLLKMHHFGRVSLREWTLFLGIFGLKPGETIGMIDAAL